MSECVTFLPKSLSQSTERATAKEKEKSNKQKLKDFALKDERDRF